ncbi:apolipoprotein L3-like [Xyrauchen texanus]|uniref:apolipoprotein L3-like n=1 Tax=Xyrauchen texanus TaxID=154827 RepID=UPI002242A00C|nr:apolipoprotein L3-like [Xyrauchen texanus]
MASLRLHRRRRSIEKPPDLADVIHLKKNFFELYETDYLQLQLCISKLQNIIKTFEEDFRRATKGTRDGGLMGIAGGAFAFAGLALAPFTAGRGSLVAGVAAGVGAVVGVGGAIKGGISSSEKTKQMTQIRKDIEAELKTFQNKISRITDKLKDIHLRIEKILEDFNELESDANYFSRYFASASQNRNIRREDIVQVANQIKGILLSIGTVQNIISAVNLVIDMLSIIENTKTLNDMDKLAKIPIDEQINELDIRSKAGKFIVKMRKVIHELQNIMKELEEIKEKLSDY